MTNETTVKSERDDGSLAQRLRDEGGHSDCKYQCERLHGFAGEVEALLAQLEAAEADSGRLEWVVAQWHKPNSPGLGLVVGAFRTGNAGIVRSAIDVAKAATP